MSELREAAQAVVAQFDADIWSIHNAIDRLRSALAQPEAEPVVIGPEWAPCIKLPITVHVREQRPGEQHVSTREGITPVRPDDLIMRGVAGEEYPIGRELFAKTYRIGAHPPRSGWRPASEPPEESAAHAMGASGSPVVEGERLAFEAWMRGHCWELRATWTGDQYIGTDEGDVKSIVTKGMLDADAMRTRMMWAAWRDRGALARLQDIDPPEQEGER